MLCIGEALSMIDDKSVLCVICVPGLAKIKDVSRCWKGAERCWSKQWKNL